MAVALRFTALDWGLRETPHVDERYFVEHVARMLATGSLDHGYYEYPGLLFYLLMPVVGLTGHEAGPAAYLAARRFIAACGVAGVMLTFVFGRRLMRQARAESDARPEAMWGADAPALLAAAFMAVSPLDVETAHMLRPDVPLQALLLVFGSACLALGGRLRDDARAGAALGLAIGLKFSAALAAPVYVARRLWLAGDRARGLCVAGLACALTFLAASPYALLRRDAFRQGVNAQLAYHYARSPDAVPSYFERLSGYAAAWPHALGPLGALLALVGLVLALRAAPRVVAPFLILPPLTALVFAGTDFIFTRHMLPSLPVLALMASLAVARMGTRRPRLAALVGLLALAFPLAASLRYLEQVARPSTRERASAWIDRHAPPGRILTTLGGVRVDPRRFEVLRPRRLDPLQVAEAGLIVSLAEEQQSQALDGWPADESVRPSGPYEGLQIFLRVVPGGRRARLHALSLAAARLRVSARAGDAERLRDGEQRRAWRVSGAEARGAFISLAWPAAQVVSRVELLLGDALEPALHLRLLVSDDGRSWRAQAHAPGRPAPEHQLAALAPLSEVLLFEPQAVRALRIERRAGARPWSVAELRVFGPR